MTPSRELSDGSNVEIWTLGHGQSSVPEFLALLREHAIGRVVDVRSRPGSKWVAHFNSEALEKHLNQAQIIYDWKGDALGGIPDGERFYDDEGYTLYDPLVREPWFMKAIGWLEYEAERSHLALVCVEKEPERCHRHELLARVLVNRGATVRHISHDGSTETWQDVELRLGRGQEPLFNEAVAWRSPEPMRRAPDPLPENLRRAARHLS